MSERSAPRSWLRPLLRAGLTASALGLWWWLADLQRGELVAAFGRISSGAVAAAFMLSLSGLWVGALRWRLLLDAGGAKHAPSISRLSRVYLIATFYNTFLPANVGGDVLRGHATRGCFPGASGAYMVVFLERVFGLAGLLVLAGLVMLLHPLPGLEGRPWVGALGLALALGAALAPGLARRLGSRLPAKLSALAKGLPAQARPLHLFGVLALSLLTQDVVALVGYTLISSMDATVALGDALLLVPVALVSVYLPTIAGLGAREAAFVFLFGLVGVDAAIATASSLAFLGVNLSVALLGGLVHITLGADVSPFPPEGERG